MIAYFDCYSGASGDMVLGALVGAGLSVDHLKAELAKLPVTGYSLQAESIVRRGFHGTQVVVRVIDDQEQPHRHLSDILRLIEDSSLSNKVRETAGAIFRRLAEAEAAVHGSTIEEVHFHEVGAVDSIVDIVGAAIGFEALGIERIYASAIPTGYGMVKSAHGMIPIPGPAVLELLKNVGATVYPGRIESELTTPTGAAILATLATFESPRMTVQSIGYGFGQREFPWPNALRLWLGDPVAALQEDEVCVIDANLDDSTPEELGAAMEELLAQGALDVYFTPIQMKKNRPATKLSIIAPVASASRLAETALLRTSSLGVRLSAMRRVICQRWQESVETPWGPVRIKVKAIGDRRSAGPEYDDCVRIARENGISLREVYEAVKAAGGGEN